MKRDKQKIATATKQEGQAHKHNLAYYNLPELKKENYTAFYCRGCLKYFKKKIEYEDYSKESECSHKWYIYKDKSLIKSGFNSFFCSSCLKLIKIPKILKEDIPDIPK